MTTLKNLIIKILIQPMTATAILVFVNYYIRISNNGQNIQFSVEIKISLVLLLSAIMLLILIYSIPYFKKKVINYKAYKNSIINLLEKAYIEKPKSNIKKLTIPEKYILNKYYFKQNKSSEIFSDFFKDINIINSLCKKGILYKALYEKNISEINFKLNEHTYHIHECAENYIKKHPRILKYRIS